MSTRVKICGLKTPEAVDRAVEAGADFVGFVFYPPSPRAIEIDLARKLAERVPDHVKTVALVVDANDILLTSVARNLKPDYLQAHGSEDTERVEMMTTRLGIPVIKAIKVAGEADIERARTYRGVADMLLFDAKAPQDLVDALPGGNGISFDWSLLAGSDAEKEDFMLSGGLTPENVQEAIAITGAPIVDVSSGVEKAPGEKDLDKITRFIGAAKSVPASSAA